MKKILTIVSIVLVISMISCSVIAAEGEVVSPYASAFFTSTTASLYSIDEDTFGVWFDALGKYKMDAIGASSVKIQRSATGTSSWTTVKTFSSAAYSNLLSYNTVYHGDYVTYTGTPGYYYRAYVIFYAEKGGNTGRYASYTDVIHL